MKKILSIALALCLALSLSVAAIAADGSVTLDPSVHLPAGPGADLSNNSFVSKYTYSAVDENGNRISGFQSSVVDSTDPVAAEVADYGNGVVLQLSIGDNVLDSARITVNVYAPGAKAGYKVIKRNTWSLVEGANLQVNGDRVTFTVTAGEIRAVNGYFAIVEKFDEVNVNVPQEPPTTEEDPDQTPDMNVEDKEPEKDDNPKTGIALAVVPMIVAAAAIVVSKKR